MSNLFLPRYDFQFDKDQHTVNREALQKWAENTSTDIAGKSDAGHTHTHAHELGYTEVTADQTGIGTTATDLTGLSVTVAVGTRPIRVIANVQVRKQTNAGLALLEIYDSTASAIRNQAHFTLAAGDDCFIHIAARLAPAAGSRTYKLRLYGNTNTIDLKAAANQPASIQVVEV